MLSTLILTLVIVKDYITFSTESLLLHKSLEWVESICSEQTSFDHCSSYLSIFFVLISIIKNTTMLNSEPITTATKKDRRNKDENTSKCVDGYQVFHSSVTVIVTL